jgi:hypothetical protein
MLSRRYMREFASAGMIDLFLMLCVFGNTVILGMDGLVDEDTEAQFVTMNLVFTVIFGVEMVIKLYGFGLKEYCADYFNVFDGFVVILSFVEIAIEKITAASAEPVVVVLDEDGEDTSAGQKSAISAFRAIRIFRIFRVLRVTRLLRGLLFMKIIVQVIGKTIEDFAYISMLLFLMIIIFSLLGMQIFGGNFVFEDQEYVRMNFDTFFNAFLSNFQILTLENWTDILVLAFRSSSNSMISVVFLLTWIFIGNFIFLNLFLAVLLDGFGDPEVLLMKEEIEDEILELNMLVQEKKEFYHEKSKTKKEHNKTHKVILDRLYERSYRNNSEADQQHRLGGSPMLARQMTKKGNESKQYQEESENFKMKYWQLNEIDVSFDEFETKQLNTIYTAKFTKVHKRVDIWKDVCCKNSVFCLTKKNSVRKCCAYLGSHDKFETVVITLIVLSS